MAVTGVKKDIFDPVYSKEALAKLLELRGRRLSQEKCAAEMMKLGYYSKNGSKLLQSEVGKFLREHGIYKTKVISSKQVSNMCAEELAVRGIMLLDNDWEFKKGLIRSILKGKALVP